jgi:tRNA A-37 threonylcarbamoyl transferase component Bud32
MPPTEDPTLPGLRLLVDRDAAVALVREALRGIARVTDVRATQVRHDRGRRVIVRYAVHVMGADGRDRVETVVAQHGGPTPPGATVLAAAGGEGPQVAVWRYPFDPHLPGLPPAAHAEQAGQLLHAMGLCTGTVRVVPRTYRATRRAVLEVTSDGADQRTCSYLKVVRPTRVGRILQAHIALDGVVPVPRVLAVAHAQGVLVLAPLAGATLRDRLLQADGMPDPAEVTALQRRMARAEVQHLPGPARTPDITHHAEVLTGLLPGDEGLIRRVAAVAEGAAGPDDAVVHGDLYEAQLIVGHRGELALLDLDGVGEGALVDDCATMLAHLHVLAQWRPAAASAIRAWARGYARACGAHVDPVRLRHRTAGVLLALAAGGFTVQEPCWEGTARQRLDLAVELVGSRPPGWW